MKSLKVLQLNLMPGASVSLTRDTTERTRVAEDGPTHIRVLDGRWLAVWDDRDDKRATLVPCEQVKTMVVGKAELLALLELEPADAPALGNGKAADLDSPRVSRAARA
jgi:hypothetical protein